MTQTSTQTSLADTAEMVKDAFINDWTLWRDAQMTDEHKQLVDATYSEVLANIDKLIEQLIPF